MRSTTVKWIGQKQFVAVDSSRHSVVMSTQDEGNGIGMKPVEMLLAGLAGCTAVDVVEILAKKRVKLHALEVRVDGVQDPEPPWAFQQIHVHYRLSGEGLTERAVEQAIHLSDRKYCAVAATVRGVAKITTDFEIVQVPEVSAGLLN